MRDPSHQDQILRQAKYILEHPTTWKQQHTIFINALYEKAQQFVDRLAKQTGGKEKLMNIYHIKNKNVFL